jgi:hypothetical protein
MTTGGGAAGWTVLRIKWAPCREESQQAGPATARITKHGMRTHSHTCLLWHPLPYGRCLCCQRNVKSVNEMTQLMELNRIWWILLFYLFLLFPVRQECWCSGNTTHSNWKCTRFASEPRTVSYFVYMQQSIFKTFITSKKVHLTVSPMRIQSTHSLFRYTIVLMYFFFYIHIYCIISLYIFRTPPLQPSFTLAYTATVYTLYRPLICTSFFLATEVSHCGISLFIWHCHFYALVDAAKRFLPMSQTRKVPVVFLGLCWRVFYSLEAVTYF